jgi:hypothetical protein
MFCLLKGAFSRSDYVPTNSMQISEWEHGKDGEGSGRGHIFRLYPGTRLKSLRKTMKNLRIADLRGRYLNPGPPEYAAEVYPLDREIRRGFYN